MIFEITKEFIYIDNIQILVIFFTIFAFILTLIIIELYFYISIKLHNSYHNGYNQAKNDKVKYYKTIKKFIDSYDNIFNELRKESLNVDLAKAIIDFKAKLLKYQQK